MNSKIGKRRGSLGIFFLMVLSVFFLMSVNVQVQAAEEIKIGLVSALTGTAGTIGQAHLAGAKVAAMHINEEGGILGRKVIIEERDDLASPANGVKVTRELMLNHGVKFLTGMISTSSALAVMPLVEQLNGVLITASPVSEKITGVNCSPNTFRISVHGDATGKEIAKLAHEKYPNIKRWGGINPDLEFGHASWNNFEANMKRLDPSVTIVPSLFSKFGATNFEPQILKLLEEKIEGLYGVLYANDFIAFVKQAHKYKLWDQVNVFLDHAVEIESAEPLGHDMVNVWGGAHYNYKAYDNKLNKKFIEGHKKLFGTIPVFAASETYSALYAYKYAIEKANSFETKDVIKALRGLTFDTVTGKRRFRPEDHQAEMTSIFSHFVPTKEAPGWKISEFHLFPIKDYIPKPTDSRGGCKMKW